MKEFPRVRIFKCLAPIDPTGGVPVAEHLRHIFYGHLHAHHAGGAVGLLPVIRPVFQMMPVAALVVKPGGGVSFVLPLRVVGAAVALEILDAHPEFLRRVFGKIVCQTLPIQAQTEAVSANQGAVAVDGM
ncbi:hypothetical protein SDC9_92160 [bioreactor metagenome]|uniref:Uncharacterized protein n=1 Tax=bioreactor metagenome TaxID=1076179 RepID=A0A645A3P1_9ZZZZ